MNHTARNGLALLAGAFLASCAGDNPENVPLYGQWEMTTRVDSLSIDGMQVPPDQYPPEFKALAKTEKRCGEPMFIDRDWQEEDINRRVPGSCRLATYDITPTRVTGSGACRDVAPEAEFNPEFALGIDQAESSYRMVLTIEGSALIRGVDGRHYIKATAVQDGVRSSDC